MRNEILPSNIADLLLDAVILVDRGGTIVYASAACERIFGYARQELVGNRMIDLVVPEDRARTWEESMRVMAGEPRIGFENRYIRKDGRLVHIMWSARWLEDEQLRVGVARDVSSLKHAEDLQAATYAISEAAHDAHDLAGLFQAIHRVIAKLVSPAGFAVAMTDRRSGRHAIAYQCEMLDSATELGEILHAAASDAAMHEAPTLLPAAKRAGDVGPAASWMVLPLAAQKRRIGTMVLKSHPGTAYGDKEIELLQYVSRQVTMAVERLQLHSELLQAARYDDLTRLANRRRFAEQVEAAMTRSRRAHARFAILFLDVNDFKKVNDNLGHDAGDRLLCGLADALRASVREEDTCARLGGDEFAVLLNQVRDMEAAQVVANHIREMAGRPQTLEGQDLSVRVSIGIALFPDHGVTLDRLLRHADEGMYQDKQSRKAASV